MPKKIPRYYTQRKIPVKVVKELAETKKTKNIIKFDKFRRFLKIGGQFALALFSILILVKGISAFESHIINVTARICRYSESGTIGFWRNHSEIYKHYLPIYLGDFPIDDLVEDVNDANNIFINANAQEMRDHLTAHLLAAKFNIAHYGIGDYEYGDGSTYEETVEYADELLRQDPEPPREELERVKDLLVQVNELKQVAACGKGYPITVLDPNGGENWWTHETFTIMWLTEGLNCSGHLGIDLWYSADSGKTWANVAEDEEDDGAYDWEIPILLGATNDYYVPSEQGRIKAIAKCDTFIIAGWDISDEDFTITLDENSLTEEERKLLIGMGLMTYHQEEITDVENATSSLGESPSEPTTGCEPEALQLCNTGNLGVCVAGTQACNQEGFWGECVQDNTSTTEICDNQLDDDCDGTIDCDDEDCAEDLACQPEPYCGDGVINGEEQCDEGENNGTECVPEYGSSCTYCSTSCETIELTGPYCGDGNLDETEECDDGNTEDGDGCSASCVIETPEP